MADYEPFMRRALELAAASQGRVEPNPMVGAVIVRDGRIIAEGAHERFGGPHAEVNALNRCPDPAGATIVVSLEPCCHFGKTPPCTQAVIRAGIARVVTACRDPFPAVAGRGVRELTAAGIEVVEGILEAEARALSAPFFKLRTLGFPYVIVKWAMSLDGRIATATGDSQWISGEASRRWVHDLRGRVDAIVVGLGTVLRDDPLLTCRTQACRVATRIVLDALAETPITSQLVRTAREVPLIVATTGAADAARRHALEAAGAEVLVLPAAGACSAPASCGAPAAGGGSITPEGGRATLAAEGGWATAGRVDLVALCRVLGEREMTNVLVEGGSAVFGSFFDAGLVDEAAVFVAPRVVGAAGAVPAVAGRGVERIAHGRALADVTVTRLEDDVLIRGRFRPSSRLQFVAKKVPGTSSRYPVPFSRLQFEERAS